MKKMKKMRRNFVGAGIGVFISIASLTACGSGNNEAKANNTNKEVSKVEVTQEPIATPEVTPEPTETPEEKEARETREFLESLPIDRRAAVESALNYISCMPFSTSGLYEQLLFEGFSEQDSEFAVNCLNIDYDQMCYEKAISYITNIGGFSKQSLIDQLVYEGFTEEQAKKAVKRLGYK